MWRLSSEVLVPTDWTELSEPLSSGSFASEASGLSGPSLPGSSFPESRGFHILAMVLYGPGLVTPVVVYSLVSSALLIRVWVCIN